MPLSLSVSRFGKNRHAKSDGTSKAPENSRVLLLVYFITRQNAETVCSITGTP